MLELSLFWWPGQAREAAGAHAGLLGEVGGPSHLEDRCRQWVWFNPGMEGDSSCKQFQMCSAPSSRPGRGSSSFLLPLGPPWPGKSLEFQWIRGAGPSPATKKGFGFSCFQSWGEGALQEFCQGFREGLLASCPGRCSDTDVSWGWRNVHPQQGSTPGAPPGLFLGKIS